jgi:NAD+ synthase
MLKDPAKTKNEIVAWIRGYFEKNGPGCAAVVGVSGGKDSSVTAALLVEALGRDRVIGVLMPNGVQSDISDSQQLVDFLGIPHVTVNIKDGFDGLSAAINKALAGGDIPGTTELSRDSIINLPPRLRMSTLYAIGQALPCGARVVNTCNRSEDYIGYSTKFGDAAGDFSPLSNLLVHEVLQIGDVLGLPEHLVRKTPSDGLSGLSDEDKIGFTYAVLDHYILTGECENEEHRKKIDRLHRINMHKLRPIPRYMPAEEADKRDIANW